MHRRDRARCLAYAPQTPVLPDGVTTRDYVTLGRTPHRPLLAAPRGVDRQVVADVMDRLGLGPLAERPLATLSGGEQQRAVLARALAQQPRVLLLDEPTASLDLGHAQQVLDLVDRLRRQDGLTVLSTLHDLTLAGQYADRLALLSRGPGRRRGRYRPRCSPPPRCRRTTAPAPRWSPGRTGPTVLPVRAGVNGAARKRQRVARPQLGRRRQVRRRHDGQHRIAAGHRMVGEEQHRGAVRRHLHGPGHQPLAGQLVVAGPGQRRPGQPEPDPVAVGA